MLHLEKVVFFPSLVEFLGQHMTAEGIRPLGPHVAAIAAHPKPSQVAADEFPGDAQPLQEISEGSCQHPQTSHGKLE